MLQLCELKNTLQDNSRSILQDEYTYGQSLPIQALSSSTDSLPRSQMRNLRRLRNQPRTTRHWVPPRRPPASDQRRIPPTKSGSHSHSNWSSAALAPFETAARLPIQAPSSEPNASAILR